jgi:glycosyltransferase involved in cell wall biosynthesis
MSAPNAPRVVTSLPVVPRVLIVRGHLATPWELAPWQELPERFRVAFLRTRSNGYQTSQLQLRSIGVRARRDLLPRGRLGDLVTGVVGDRYLGEADEAFADADIVHAEELSFWFAADAARRKARHAYRLVQTVWETIPFLHAYRNRHARRFRDEVLDATDLFLPATERARDALLLEGVDPDRILVCPPGIDVDRFSAPGAGAAAREHVVLSPGRLVWEKGHQDVIRAIAALRRGLVGDGNPPPLRLVIVGSGPERQRLEAHAGELGVDDVVSFDSVPYEEMPHVFAQASCMVLASTAAAAAAYHPFDLPRAFWEEQFGLVLAEGMAAGLDIIAGHSGAIPEVLAGHGTLVPSADWRAIAEALLRGPLARIPGARVQYPPELVARYSTRAMAARLAGAYERVLA